MASKKRREVLVDHCQYFILVNKRETRPFVVSRPISILASTFFLPRLALFKSVLCAHPRSCSQTITWEKES